MKTLLNGLEKTSKGLYIVEKWVLILAVIVEVGINFINVLLRYIVGRSLSFCETLSVVLFMLMVLVGGNIAVKSESEIKIDIFKFKNPKTQAGYKIICEIITILAVVWLFSGTVTVLQGSIKIPSQVIPLPIFTYHEYAMMLIGLGLILLDHIITLLRHVCTMTEVSSGKGGALR